MIRFPDIDRKLGLGVGLDLPWGAPIGFEKKEAEERPTDQVQKFFHNYEAEYNYFFFSYQPKDKNQLSSNAYKGAYQKLVDLMPGKIRAFHHTRLNLATTKPYEKESIIKFTNELIDELDFAWINEDLGLWSLDGKGLAYPLPPILTKKSLEACIRNVSEYQEGFRVPLCIEFPGFTEGSSFFIGKMNAFEFFRKLAVATDSPVTLDIGHLLSYQWFCGRSEKFLEGLEELPLEHCFEIHLSGCQIKGGQFLDLHHGILIDEQIELLDYLLEHCPNVKAVTYEDPKFDSSGKLIPKSIRNYTRLKERVQQWHLSR